MTSAPVLSARGARFRYLGARESVGPFDLDVDPGGFHLVTGPSGCGKSTFARLLAGVIPHLYRGDLGGDVRVRGRCSRDAALWDLAADVGLVAQNPASQILATTVENEVAFGLENLGLPAGAIRNRIRRTLERFGLQDFLRRDPRTLSGGEQQKLVLAAVMARAPRALVLDEPLSMLDRGAVRELIGDLASLRERGTAVVAFEHRMHPFDGVDDLERLDLPAASAAEEELPELAPTVPAFHFDVENLRVELGGRPVLRGVDLPLEGGRIVAVVGPNGAGKTTLLRALAGLQRYEGRIGSAANEPPLFGLCFQNADRQIFNPSVRQEILYGCAEPDEEIYRRVIGLLGLAAYEDTPPLLLSEGQKKRLSLGILLVRRNLACVCLDEPTLGQDAAQKRLLGRILRRLAAAGFLFVVATHDLEWARDWADEVALLDAGQIVERGTPAALLRDQVEDVTAADLSEIQPSCGLEHRAL